MRTRRIRILSIILILALLLIGCTTAKEETQSGDITQENQTDQENDKEAGNISAGLTSKIVVDTDFTARDLEVGYEETTATRIVLKDDDITVTGEGTSTAGSVLTITKEGSYVVEGTLKNGQIIIDAGDSDKIHMILNGVSITCLSNAPIYIRNADKVFITLAEAENNYLIDGQEYIQTDENTVDGVIFSKSDLTINGLGSLTINGNYKHGIVSKDELVFTGGTYDISAVKDTINGKDCVKINDGFFTLNAATGNGIQSKNSDASTKGFVYIAGGTIDIVSCKEGIEGTAIIIEDGIININSSDDGLNASSADGVKEAHEPGQRMPGADQEGQGTTGKMPTGEKPNGEPPEGMQPGGEMGSRGGFGGGENPFEVDENCYIQILGGTITINTQGDGIDSNGDLYIFGGTIYINGPTESRDGSIDYPGKGEITGGSIIAAGSSGMAQGFSETSTQCSFLYNLISAVDAGTTVILTDKNGETIISYTPASQYQSVVISTPGLIQGEIYTLTCGTQVTEITLTSIATGGQSMNMGR